MSTCDSKPVSDGLIPADLPGRPTREEFRRTLWRGALPPLLLLAALAAFVSLLLFQLLRANTFARQSEETISRTSDIERLIVSMETGIRGYMLSGSEDFLEPYTKAQARIEPAFDDLKQRFASSPSQLEQLNELRNSLDRWVALETPLRAAVTTTRDPATLSALRDRKVLVDDMRNQIRQIMLREANQRSARYDNFERASTLAVLGSIGLSMTLGIGLALINRRTIKRLSAVYQNALDAEAIRAVELASSNKQFLDLADAIPQLVWISDGEGKPVYFNSPWGSFTGSTIDQLTQSGWQQALHEDDREVAGARWKDSLQNGKPFEAEYRIKRASDGTYRWFLCRAMQVRDQSGKSVRWFGSCTDIESQKHLEHEREALLAAERKARSDLLRTSLLKDQFLATLSHELRTPMTAILGWTQLLRDPVIRQQSLDRAIDSIDSNARTQARLIEDLLDMSRILSGKLALKPERVDLRELVDAAVDAVGSAVTARQVILEKDIPADQDFHLQGDPARLQQVLWNLLSNAVKFTPTGGQVRLSLKRSNHHAEIVISDTGRGIRPEFLPHVFERFRQADGSTTRQHGGLGLGLAIVKHLVEMHGGTVLAASEGEGKGATFTVELPLNAPVVRPNPNQPDAPKTNSESLRGQSILLVEDDRDAAEIVRTILERAGAKITLAGSGCDALVALRQDRFNLMISDIGMPEMDGYGLITRLRQSEAATGETLPAIALTAFASKDDREEALAAGFQMHLTKPVAAEELILNAARLAKKP